MFAIPFIKTTAVIIDTVPKTEWVFFSSKNGVNSFFRQRPKNLNPFAKYACIGSATAQALLKFVNEIDWVSNSNDTQKTGTEFAKIAGDALVLFPIARNSIRTIQQQFPDQKNVIDIIVYETHLIIPESIPEHDVIVFTSPSNVAGYFQLQKVNALKRYLAIGNTTADALRKFGINDPIVSKGFSDIELLCAVNALK